MMRSLISLTLIIAILFAPFTVFAQTASSSCSTITSSNYNSCCPSTVDPNSAIGQACTTYYYTTVYSSGAAPSTTNGAGTTGGQTPGLSNNTPGVTTNVLPTSGLTGGAQYTPQVALQFGANGKFGGLSFKGVGAALLSCSGFGSFISGFLTNALNKVKGAVITGAKAVGGAVLGAAEGIPYIGGFIKGIANGIGKAAPKKGDDAQHPLHEVDDALVQKAACLDGIAYVLSQQVLQQITNRTLHWANTGFNGNPLYIKDIDSYLLSLKNQQINSFLQNAQRSNPIFGNALRSIVTLQVTGRYDGLLNTSLNTPQSQLYNSFMSNFTNGGWNAFSNPAYNPIGALFNASDTITANIFNVQQNTRNELQQGNGFLNMKTCVQYSTTGTVANNTVNGSGLTGSNTPTSTGLSNNAPTCLKYQTVTPGSIIAMQVANITNSPVHQAELATQFNEAVGSFFDSLLNQLFSRGLSGIKGTANQADLGLDYGGLGSNDVIGSDGQVIADINAGQADINSIASKNSGTVDISHPQLLRTVIQTQYDYLDRASDSNAVLDRLVPELGRLDYCLPGPNPTWQDSFDDNFTTYSTAAKATQISTDSTISNIGLSLHDKFTDTDVPITDRTLSITGTGDAKSYVQSVHDSLSQNILNEFSSSSLANAYAATVVGTTNQDYARGMATTAYDEVGTLPSLAQTVITSDQNYSQSLTNTQADIQELQSINSDVLKIVAAAKARYIAAQKAAGTPVNQQCIDSAYVIDTSAVTGVTRQETNVQSPLIQQTLDANTYFYNSL